MKCCIEFNARNYYSIESGEYAEQLIYTGFCPKCNTFVLVLKKKRFDGNWIYETFKRKKALKMWDKFRPSIIREIIQTIQYGNKSNMAFKYGLNIEDNKKVKQYAVDFNGTKELINEMPYC